MLFWTIGNVHLLFFQIVCKGFRTALCCDSPLNIHGFLQYLLFKEHWALTWPATSYPACHHPSPRHDDLNLWPRPSISFKILSRSAHAENSGYVCQTVQPWESWRTHTHMHMGPVLWIYVPVLCMGPAFCVKIWPAFKHLKGTML